MIEITLDLGKVPSVLEALSNERLPDKLVKVAAESYVDQTHDWIDRGKAFKPRHGILQQSIGSEPGGPGVSVIYAHADYASFVEFGTAPHVIEPKAGREGLKIPIPGRGFFISGPINHPGSKPHPFFFADRSNREDKMQEKVISVLAAHLDV